MQSGNGLPYSMEEPILTSDLTLGSLGSFEGQESLTPTFDAPLAEDRVEEVVRRVQARKYRRKLVWQSRVVRTTSSALV
jgi:hypothetical protein